MSGSGHNSDNVARQAATGMGADSGDYAAFLSYAHTDAAAAKRLHHALETYRYPKTLALDNSALRPIFRDTAELSAHPSLPDTIRAAIARSKRLIVLCSPAAAASHWVNAEIRLFREIHGERGILCALLDGTPATSFPAALTETGVEPLAADLSGGRDGFQAGITQIAASLLGVGLDTLVRREAARKRKTARIALTSAATFSALMGGLTLTAISARQDAEASRSDAEALVEYMVTELKSELEPVGRLDILDGVGERVMDYYSRQNPRKMSQDRVSRQARAQHILVQVALDAGRMDTAAKDAQVAFDLTQQVLARNSHNARAIFTHAQSAYWLGEVAYRSTDFQTAKIHHKTYRDLTQRLIAQDGSDFDYIMEAAWGENNMGRVETRLQNPTAADSYFKAAIVYFDHALNDPALDENRRLFVLKEKANTLAGAAEIAHTNMDVAQGAALTAEQIKLYEEIISLRPHDTKSRFNLIRAQSRYHVFYENIGDLAPDLLAQKRNADALRQYDPANRLWAQNSYLSMYRLLSAGFDAAVYNEFSTLHDDMTTRFTLPVLEQYWWRDIQSKHPDVSANKALYTKRLNDTAAWVDQQIIDNQRDGDVVIQMAYRLHANGQSSRAKEFAARYLDFEWNAPLRQFPTIMVRKADAALMLGRCDAALAFIGVLNDGNVPYKPERFDTTNCVTPITTQTNTSP